MTTTTYLFEMEIDTLFADLALDASMYDLPLL